ncbi:MAG: hypothetical protein ABIO61_00905 [Thermomonas sp.]
MPRSRRQRSVIVLLVTACLLLQQVVMSALACTMPLVPAAAASVSMSAAMTPDCQAMMAAEHPAPGIDALCEKHCAPDPTSASTSSIPSIPALALPPLLHALALAPATQSCDYGSGEVFTRSDPPPRLRYCRLLI